MEFMETLSLNEILKGPIFHWLLGSPISDVRPYSTMNELSYLLISLLALATGAITENLVVRESSRMSHNPLDTIKGIYYKLHVRYFIRGITYTTPCQP